LDCQIVISWRAHSGKVCSILGARYPQQLAQVVYGNQNWSTSITGTTPEMLDIRDWPVDSGRPFTLKDVNGATEVWILGMTAMENLFGGIDLIGQIVRIKNVPFSVISVLTHKGQTGHGDDKHDGFWLARMLRLGILPSCFY